jgi:hypothetical protein
MVLFALVQVFFDVIFKPIKESAYYIFALVKHDFYYLNLKNKNA